MIPLFLCKIDSLPFKKLIGLFRKATEFPFHICFQSQPLLLSTYFILDPMVELVAKNLPADVGDMGSIPGSGRSLEEGRAIHSSILAWRIP